MNSANEESGVTPLIAAAKNEKDECVQLLINKGADVNIVDSDGNTALMYEKHVNCVKLLLEAGADVNHGNQRQKTALMFGADSGREDIVSSLIKAGADVNFADSYGNTPLMYASSAEESIKSVELLLEAGADVNHSNEEGDTALMSAVGSRQNDVVTLLIKAGANMNAANEMGSTAVYNFAISAGEWECAEILAEAGADLNVMSDDKTPLMWAVEEDRETSAEALIKAGADVNKVNHDGCNVLHWAAGRSKEFYQMFIAAGVDVNAKMSESCGGETPLMQCLGNCQYDCAELLIKAGADVNITCEDNLATALFRAQETDGVKLLLRSGARINVRNKEGKNALEQELSRKRRKLEEYYLVLFATGETVNEVNASYYV